MSFSSEAQDCLKNSCREDPAMVLANSVEKRAMNNTYVTRPNKVSTPILEKRSILQLSIKHKYSKNH